MATEIGLMPSLLDRLIDPESDGTSWRRGYGLEQMNDAVRRDLEDLLNTRQSSAGLPTEYVETTNSLISYGLPDLTSYNSTTAKDRRGLARVIEAMVERFEPRLRDVRAIPIDDKEADKSRSLRFRIDARLKMDPAPEVAFETILELTTGHYSVKSG